MITSSIVGGLSPGIAGHGLFETSAHFINRFCSSGLQSIAIAADRIRTGGAQVALAGGLESMSMIPMAATSFPNPYLVEHYPTII